MSSIKQNSDNSSSAKTGHWRRPAALIAAFSASLLGLGGLAQIATAPQAAAATTGTFTSNGWFYDTNNGTKAGTYTAGATQLSSPMLSTLDNNLLMVSGNTLGGYIGYYVNDGTPPTNSVFKVIGSLSNPDATAGGYGLNNVTTLALDANANGHGDSPYVYSWEYYSTPVGGRMSTIMGYQGKTMPTSNLSSGSGAVAANMVPIFRWGPGDTYPGVALLPLPRYFDSTVTAYNYWSGGEVVQSTGEIFFSGGECSGLGANFRMMKYDPTTGKYNYSGKLQPATDTDRIFGTTDGCTGQGYVASDMALDALGNAYIIAVSNVPVPSMGDSSPNLTNWLVRVVPSDTGDWTYNLVAPLTVSPSELTGSSSARGWAGSIFQPYIASNSYMTYGMAFFKGALYAYTYSYPGIIKINPMSGTVTSVPPNTNTSQTPDPYSQDLASAETAIVVQGTVYNDANSNGKIDTGELGVGGVVVALYQQDPTSKVWTYEGSQKTGSKGTYSFLTGGQGTYAVRLVQPTIGTLDTVSGNFAQTNPVNAWQTFASGGVFPSFDGKSANGATVTPLCVDGVASTSTTTGGQCSGQIAAPAFDPAVLDLSRAGNDTSLDLANMPMVSTVDITSTQVVATANFGISAAGSFGDAVAGPAGGTTAAPVPNAYTPVHVNGISPQVWLGTTLGTYAGPAVNGTAHNATDDGLYIGSDSTTQGKVPLTSAIVLAGGRQYTVKADVSGPQAANALVNGWTTGVSNNNWSTSPTWIPTLAGGLATGTLTPATSTSTGTVQMRAQVTLGTIPSLADNSTGQYQGGSTNTNQTWTTPGEIEDYTFQVAPAVFRPAVAVTGTTIAGPVAVTPVTSTTGITTQNFTNITATPQVGGGVGVTAGTNGSFTVSVPTGYTISAQVYDSETGAAMYTAPTITNPTGPTATVSWGPMQLNDDVTVLVTFLQPPSATDSTMSCAPTTTSELSTNPIANGDVTSDYYTCTATVMVNSTTPLPGQTVDFWKDSGSPLVLSSDTCVSGTDGKCSVQVKVTSETADTFKLHASVDTTGAGGSVPATNWKEVSNSPLDLAFTPGPWEPVICTIVDGGTTYQVQSGQVYPYPFTIANNTTIPPTPDTVAPTGTNKLVAGTNTQSVHTYLFDAKCNPIVGYTVGFTGTGNGGGTPTVTTTQPATDTKGMAAGTVADTTAETVTVGGTLASAGTPPADSGNLTTAALTFSSGKVDDTTCVVSYNGTDFTVHSKQVYPEPFVADTASTYTPKEPLKSASATADSVVTVRAYLCDTNHNPVPGYKVSFAGTPAMQPDGTTPTTATVQGTTSSAGYATGTVTDKKAETVNVGGTYASPDTPPTDTGNLVSAAITFTPGPPATCEDLGDCPCADPHDTATNLSVSPMTAQIPNGGVGKVVATAHITDIYCNAVADGVTVNFAVNPTTGQTAPAGTGSPHVGAGSSVGTTATLAVTTVNGDAIATVSDSTAEKVDVAAAITAGAIHGSPQTVEFTPGDFDPNTSTLACTPTSSSTETPVTPVVSNNNGATDYWTCVVAAKDGSGNPLASLDVTKFTFTQSTGTATQTTPVVNSGGGNYTVKFYSEVADGTNTVKATYNTTLTVGDPQIVVPIPIKALPVCTPGDPLCPICHVNGKDYVIGQVYADPNTTATETGSSTLTVLLADKFCNAIVGATATFSKDSTDATITGSPALTNADGLATATTKDNKAETVTYGGTYDATNASSVGITGNYGSGSLISDTTSFGGTPPTGVSMVTFTAGPIDPDHPCEVTVMPENIKTTILVAHVYSGSPPWNTDGTATDGSSTVTANGSSTVALRTWLLDANCNPVPNAKATFTGTPVNSPATSVITPATAVPTDSTGMAAATIKDSKTETVTIGGTYTPTTNTGTDDGLLRPTTATFTEGAFDPAKSVFVVAPAVDPTSASKTNWVVADGTTPYTGYVAAYDSQGNPVTGLSANDFVYTVTGVPNDPSATTQPSVKVTIGARVGNKYYVTFTTTYAAATYTVTAAAAATPGDKITGSNATDGATVTSWNNGTAVTTGTGGAPIPFQAGSATGGTDTPVQCSDGRNQSWIGVSSKSQAAGTPATVTLHLTDVNCNPVAGALVSFTPTGNAFMTPPATTTNASGVATSNVNDYSAQTVQVRASSGAAVVGPVSTTFTSGPPAVDTDCSLNPAYTQGTQLTVGATSVQLRGTTPGSTTVDALITDQYCNPVTFDPGVTGAVGVNVSFSVTPVTDGSGAPATTSSAYLNGTAGTKTYTMATDPTGHATTSLFDVAAETVNVKAQLSPTMLIKPTAGINVTFATGDFDGTHSSFTCQVTAGSANPTPIANGTDSYTCTIDAKDSTNAALPQLGTGNFAFAVTAGTPGTATNKVTPSSVTNNGDGTYTVKFTTLTADPTYKVAASWGGEQITGATSVGTTITPSTPIPFTFGTPIPPDPTDPTCTDGRWKTNTVTDPKTQVAGTPATVTTLITDKDCNPVSGEAVTWTVTSNSGAATVDQSMRSTGADGTATTNLNDKVAEYVQVSATATGAGVNGMNAGSDSVTFTAGPPVVGPIIVCPIPSMTGTQLTAVSPVQVGGTSTVTARVTDVNCNPVATPVAVTFAITSPSGTATIQTTPGSASASTVNGIATAMATDDTAEIAKVTAVIAQGNLYAPNGTSTDTPRGNTQAPIVFQAGVFSGDKSTFKCAVTSGSATPPVADGAQSYTCTIQANDGNGNGLTTTDPANPINPSGFEFGMSGDITASAVTEVNATTAPGQFQVKFTTLKSDPHYTVTVSYNGQTISGSPTVVPTPIPFQAGAPIPPDPNNPNCVTGPNAKSPKTYTQATPTTTQVGNPYSTTVGSQIITYVTDDQCNPVVGATVAFSQDKNATFTPKTTGSYTTDAAGNAYAYETDHVAETTNVTTKVTYNDPTSGAVKVTDGTDNVNSPIYVTFTAGGAVPEVPGTCADGSSGHVNGTHLTTTSPQKATENSTATAYITDQYCNPVGSVPVTFTTSPTATTSLTGPSPVNTGVVPVGVASSNSGKAVTTFTDTKAEIASITATIQISGVATAIYASAPTDSGITGWGSTTAAPSRFTSGGVDPGVLCEVTVDGTLYTVASAQVYPYPFTQDTTSSITPLPPKTTGNPTAGTTQGLRTYMFDANCNPVPGYTIAFKDGTPPSEGPVAFATTQAITDANGMAAGTVYNELAETSHAAGTYAAPGTPSPDSGNLLPGAANYKPGAPHDGPDYWCYNNTKQGTHLTVNHSSTQVNTSSVAQAYVTDTYCNPIDGASVDFSFTGATGLTPPLYSNPASPVGGPAPVLGSATFTSPSSGVLTVGGYAYVTVTNLTAETINVRATDEYIGDVQIAFTAGTLDSVDLACLPTTSASLGFPIANGNSTGGDYYTCTITPLDEFGNVVTGANAPVASDFTITSTNPTGGSVTVGTISDGTTPGTFVAKVTSTVARTDYTVKAVWNSINSASVGVQFQPGPIDPGIICDVNGQQMVVGQVYAYTPGLPAILKDADVKNGVTEGLKVFMADKDCNPVPGVTLTITPSPASPVVFAMAINPTGADGMATATASDTKPEKVTFGGTYASTANGSGNLFAGSVTWGPPAPTITGPSGTVVTDEPTISGTGSTPGDTVTVKDAGGNTYCTAVVQANLTWSCNPTNSTTPPAITKLPRTGTKASPAVTATETDAAGTDSDPSTAKTVSIDMTPATISGPDDGAVLVADNPPISGGPNSAPYSSDPSNPTTVDVTMPNASDPTHPIVVCTATVNPDGSWSCTPAPGVLPDPGNVQLTPVVNDSNGGSNPGQPITVKITNQQPTIDKPLANTTVIVARPPVSGTAPASNDPANPTKVTVTTTDPNSGNQITVCNAIVAQNGTWSCTPTADLPAGPVDLTPTVMDASGGTLRGAPISMLVNTTAPTINAVAASSNQTPALSGTGTVAGDKITVKDTSNGNATVCTAIVTANLTWSCTPSAGLSFGTHNLTATQTDASGNNGTPSAPVAVAVNAIAVQTGGLLAASASGTAAAGGSAMAGVWVAIAAFRRREEAPAA